MNDKEDQIPESAIPEQEPAKTEDKQQEIENYKDKYLRLLAEADNTRRRLVKEKQEATKYAIDSLFADILAPIDQLENALKFASQSSAEIKNWAIGFQMILAQFKEILLQHGVSEFSSENEMFDPSKHEAVEIEETETAIDGQILKEFVKGYRSGDRIIRAARVKVAKNKIKEEEKNHVKSAEEEK